MVLEEYKKLLTKVVQLYYPISKEELSPIIDYSISKRYDQCNNVELVDSYKNRTQRLNLLQLTDWIMRREPIVTSFGTMFKKHADSVNPLAVVVQQFLDKRSEHKNKMYEFPKGSDEYEYYNLYQQLDKIDANGIYGCLGQYSSLIYNVNVATSITSQGRSEVSTMMCFFESFLGNSVKFASVDEVLVFIEHICSEGKDRKYNDLDILDKYVTREDCFAKVVLSCGYRWVPNDDELEIIWRVINNLGQEDLNRVYYKNNLYMFCENSKIKNLIRKMLSDLTVPYYSPADVPEEIREDLEEFTAILKEYVYYGWMIPNRIDRAENMIKNICMISDTDSTIISVDAWFRFVNNFVSHEDLKIKGYIVDKVFEKLEVDEFGDIVDKSPLSPFEKVDTDYDYDFENDTLIELKHTIDPFKYYPEDNIRFSIINIMSFVLTKLVNNYMEEQTKRNHSWAPDKKCKIYSKNEFLLRRALMTRNKKNYASIQELQEGHIVPKAKQLDIKGIQALAKSSTAVSTRKALNKILLDDIMNASNIDQFKIIKDIAVLEKRIYNSLMSGSKEFYKPVTVKSQNNYETPFRIQGIKASYAWNKIKPASEDLPGINLEERNAIDIAKTFITEHSIEDIKDKYPEVYENIKKLFEEDNKLDKDHKIFKGKIDAVAIPLDVKTPEWLLELVDYKTIINNNISGFPFESIGIQRLHKNAINYTNILQI